MPRKDVSIPDDVYDRLQEHRREGESVGDVIDRLLGRRPLSEFWGAWSDETADRALDAIEDGRARSAEKLRGGPESGR